MKRTEKTERIMARVQNHLSYAFDEGYKNWVFIALAGSQNYGTDTSKSDVDTKLFIYPSLEELALLEEPVSRTLVLPDGEHCDVKDIRLLPALLRKQNVNSLEVLFTDFYIVNPRFLPYFERLTSKREEIARYNTKKALESMYRQMSAHWVKISGSDDENVINKSAVFIFRGQDFIEKYTQCARFRRCIEPDARDFYAHIREEKVYRAAYKNGLLISTDKILKASRSRIDNFVSLPPSKDINIFLNHWMVDLVEFTIA